MFNEPVSAVDGTEQCIKTLTVQSHKNVPERTRTVGSSMSKRSIRRQIRGRVSFTVINF